MSADALQVYTGLEILTGAATPGERVALEHRLLSFLPVDATFSAGQYAELAHAEIDSLLAAVRRPIVVGGTGLYLRAALTELSLRPMPAEGVRGRWLTELERRGPGALHAILDRRAPWAAAEIAPSDRQRIVRALELLDSGELEPPPERSQLWSDEMRHPTLLVGLVMERERLYARIEARVDAMVADGVEHEVRRASARGASPTARKALGFEELLAGDLEATKRAITQALSLGYRKQDIAVLSFRGREGSVLTSVDQLGPHRLRSFTGSYDLFGNPEYREGDVLLESIYRFKGQSAPCVILTEVDFDAFDEQVARKFFVGATRATMKLIVVASERAALAFDDQH